MSVYTYKPALLVGPLEYALNAQGMVCTDKHGKQKWRLRWDDVTGAAFVEHKVKASRIRRFDLLGEKRGEERSISYTGGLGNPAADPDGVAQLDLIAACLDQLAARDPRFQVSIGEYGRSRVVIFSIGLSSLVGAVALGGLMLATGVSSDRLAGGFVPVLLLVAMGAMLTYSHVPWRDLPRAQAARFADTLRMIAHPETQRE